jgi:hypothetical protein
MRCEEPLDRLDVTVRYYEVVVEACDYLAASRSDRAILHPAFAGTRLVQMDYLRVGPVRTLIDSSRGGRPVLRDEQLMFPFAELRRETRDQASERFRPRMGRDNDR